jgi:hypothetical protein
VLLSSVVWIGLIGCFGCKRSVVVLLSVMGHLHSILEMKLTQLKYNSTTNKEIIEQGRQH